MACEMQSSGLIAVEEAVSRVTPDQLDEIMHSMVDPASEKEATLLAKGLPAGPAAQLDRLFLRQMQQKNGQKKVMMLY
ncbi:MAG: hypothetical protein CM1200mP10_11810 [Candidatus Neomarinimicrobiota bacterium]|nr:MAG: hypothetical protein CM1200mP10_11810 [Candidatus Neomarinimicrobiota bacterium]